MDVPLWRTSYPLYGGFLKWWYPHFTPQVLIIFSRKNMEKTHGCSGPMDLTENPWFKLSERMELDFCRELAVQHKILLQEVGGDFRSIGVVACLACVASLLFFWRVCCSCCCFFLFLKIFFKGSFFWYVVKTNRVVKVNGLKGIYGIYIYCIYIYIPFYFWFS